MQSIEALDRQGMALIEAQDASGFARYMRETRNTICGAAPIAVLLRMLAAANGGGGGGGGRRRGRRGGGVRSEVRPVRARARARPHPRLRPPLLSAPRRRPRRRRAGRPVSLRSSPRAASASALRRYAQSSQCESHDDSSVSYASAVVWSAGGARLPS